MKLRAIIESIQDVTITAIDEEEDWELAEQAEQVARRCQIRISRDKRLLLIALAGDTVVGAVWATFDQDQSYREPVWDGDEPRDEPDVYCFDFDVVVDPQARATGAGMVSSNIGPKLIDAALVEYHQIAAMYGYENTFIRVQVVNPKLARFLERRYGFESSGGWSPSNPFMEFHG